MVVNPPPNSNQLPHQVHFTNHVESPVSPPSSKTRNFVGIDFIFVGKRKIPSNLGVNLAKSGIEQKALPLSLFHQSTSAQDHRVLVFPIYALITIDLFVFYFLFVCTFLASNTYIFTSTHLG